MQVEVPEYGTADVLRLSPCAIDPKATPLRDGEVLVRNHFVGVNFIDTYFRSGLYKKPSLPFVPGDEGAGEVIESTHADFPIGARVAYMGSLSGAYALYTRVAVEALALLPTAISARLGAALMCQALTAHYLTHDSFRCAPGTRVLVHSAAGGTGLLVTQMAKRRGAFVVGVCGGAAKADLARQTGADAVIDRQAAPDWVEAARGLVPNGFDAVFDGVGADTFDGSLAVLRRRGFMISFGNASGAVPAVSPLRLKDAGSVYLQRPALGDFICTPAEKEERLREVWKWVEEGTLKATMSARTFKLADAAEAHRYLESRQSTGKILLECED